MSGHSKWAQIKHKKGVADQKRGMLFTKLGNAITVAARQGGGDPDLNFTLRLAIEKARAANMPKENIERAIKRGTGELAGESLEEVTYEGFGPDKVAFIIKCLTDNKNRTVNEIKYILEKNGGSLAGPGSVMWMFKNLAVLTINKEQPLINKNIDELELELIDLGVEDVKNNNQEIVVYTKPEDLKKVKEDLENKGVKIESAEIKFVPREKIETSNEVREKLKKLFEELDGHQDVSSYYTNLA